jgi:glycosyltransferase involved in cell wall biosynthesis
MRILMMTGSLPYPPHQGGSIRAYGLLHGLHQAGHQVTLLSFHEPTQGVVVADTPLTTLCKQVVTVPLPGRATSQRLKDLLLTSQADIAQRLESEAMHTALRDLLSQNVFDLIQFEGIEISNYLFAAKKIQPNTVTIYDAFNAEAALQQIIAEVDRGDLRRLPNAIYSRIQSERITAFERLICETATTVIAVSDEDAAILKQFRPDKQVFVVPSGIFADDYEKSGTRIDLKSNALVFTGKMDYRPNVDAMIWFAKDILPLMSAQSEANLYIVGQKPHPRLDALRVQPNVEITGWVAEVQPYLQATDVYIAPLRMGSGTRLKLLEAMASGCAVVATTTAAAGLTAEVRSCMRIADDATAFAETVEDLLQHTDKRKSLGMSAQKTIRQHYDWSALIPRLLQTYKDIGLADGSD